MSIRLKSSVSRVEGSSELVIHRDREQVIDVIYKMPSARDFEPVLLSHRTEDLPRIVARICGICPVAHRLGAVKAIEEVSGTSPTLLAQTLREVALLGEVIRSHTYSVFFSTFPDLLGLSEGFRRKDITGLQKSRPRLLSSALKIYRAAGRLIEVVAGDTNMATTIVPGGVMKNIVSDEQSEILKLLHSILSGAQWAKSLYKSMLTDVREDIKIFRLAEPLFITSFDTQENRFSGTDEVALIPPSGETSTFSAVQFPEFLLEHHEPKAATRIVYNSATSPKSSILTGPQARLAALQTKVSETGLQEMNHVNLFLAGLLRLDEIEFSITKSISLLEDQWSPEGDTLVSWKARAGTAGSAVEAPRGTLLYRLSTSDDGRVSGIQIRVPTELNANSLMILVSQVVTRCLELGWPTERVLEWAKIAVRCFDPCVSCATNTKVRFKE